MSLFYHAVVYETFEQSLILISRDFAMNSGGSNEELLKAEHFWIIRN